MPLHAYSKSTGCVGVKTATAKPCIYISAPAQAFAMHAALQVYAGWVHQTVWQACAHGCCCAVFSQARLYKEDVSRAQSGMRVLYPLCSLRVMTSGNGSSMSHPDAAANGNAFDAAVGASDCSVGTHSHVLHIQQSLDDGLYHDDDETPDSMTLLATNIAGVQSMVGRCTLHLCMPGAVNMTAVVTLLFGSRMQAFS